MGGLWEYFYGLILVLVEINAFDLAINYILVMTPGSFSRSLKSILVLFHFRNLLNLNVLDSGNLSIVKVTNSRFSIIQSFVFAFRAGTPHSLVFAVNKH